MKTAKSNPDQADMFSTIEVPSYSQTGLSYQVNVVEKTCTCPAFTKQKGKKRPCKHMVDHIPELKMKALPTHPNYSMSVSALIKAIRLRHVEDAIYWLIHLRTFHSQAFRLGRRLLIISAEDNMNTAVMHRMAAFFHKGGWNVGEEGLFLSAAEVVRVCKTPNWWALEDGRHYVRDWARAERIYESKEEEFKTSSFESVFQYMADAAEAGESAHAIAAVHCIAANKMVKGVELADMLLSLAKDRKCKEAIETAEMYKSVSKTLGVDPNHPGQIAYRLSHGALGSQEPVKVLRGEVQDLLDAAHYRWADPEPIPAHYLDGIHSVGKDRRFSGCSIDMAAASSAFEHYGRLSPEDKWLPSFYEV